MPKLEVGRLKDDATVKVNARFMGNLTAEFGKVLRSEMEVFHKRLDRLECLRHEQQRSSGVRGGCGECKYGQSYWACSREDSVGYGFHERKKGTQWQFHRSCERSEYNGYGNNEGKERGTTCKESLSSKWKHEDYSPRNTTRAATPKTTYVEQLWFDYEKVMREAWRLQREDEQLVRIDASIYVDKGLVRESEITKENKEEPVLKEGEDVKGMVAAMECPHLILNPTLKFLKSATKVTDQGLTSATKVTHQNLASTSGATQLVTISTPVSISIDTFLSPALEIPITSSSIPK